MAPEMKIVKNNPNILGWNLEDGYKNKLIGDEYPLRVLHTGSQNALHISLLCSIRNPMHHCNGFLTGFRVILRTPGEEIEMSRNYIEVPLSETTHIAIKPKVTTTSDDLRNYEPNQWKCFYESERQLRIFKVYSESKCEAECLANVTYMKCGCVKFSMPRDASTKVCTGIDYICYNNVQLNLFSDESNRVGISKRILY
ncbi:pickpocket protein 28-like [Contarinia nasturtii]|uniref:pickpocket protein 28-like n=1 Tax=Contarinia nasturtii TaxID=265458 RepID=UPI0012D409D2|nr:pickpocket protein 28-like [Contarinia nasturtii]